VQTNFKQTNQEISMSR